MTSSGQNDTINVFGGDGTVQAGMGNDSIDISGAGQVTVGPGQDTVHIHGDGTVRAARAADSITIDGNGNVTVGGLLDRRSPHDTITIHGDGSVRAANGNENINVTGSGRATIGAGNDTITFGDSATIRGGGGHNLISVNGPSAAVRLDDVHGRDTITLGRGNDTIVDKGHATVHGATYEATVYGGTLLIKGGSGEGADSVTAVHGVATISASTLAGGHALWAKGGDGKTVFVGGQKDDTLVGGHQDTMTGGAGNDLFVFSTNFGKGTHLITDFVQGSDKLQLTGCDLADVLAHHVTYTGAGAVIHLADGTKITVAGATNLSSDDFKHG